MTMEWLETENKVSGESIEQACGTRVAIRGMILCPGGDQKESVSCKCREKNLPD